MELKDIDIRNLRTNDGSVAGLPKNPRKISKRKLEQLKKSVQDAPEMLKLRELIAVESDDGYVVICGNQRLEAAKALGMQTLPVKVLPKDTDPAKLREYAIKDNLPFGEDDWEVIASDWDTAELEEWGMEVPSEWKDTTEAVEDDFSADEVVECVCQKYDVWQLGRHRLMCGDSTDANDVAVLMDGNKADMVFTDPPYALFGNSTGVVGVGDDKMITPFFREIGQNIQQNTKPMAHCYVCHDWQTSATIKDAFKGLTPKNLIVWRKAEAGGLGSFYTKIYELVWLFANEPEKGIMGKNKIKARTINGVPNIWDCTVVKAEERDHNAQKPVKMISIAIENSTDQRESVLDLFGGSGSTLIAAEQLNRTCYMMELDPHYCDVIIARWEKLTGQTAVKIN